MKMGTVGDYLLNRLSEIGIGHLFGVSGPDKLPFLDQVIAHPALRWVGCTNPLNAAWAADGYARCKPAAALITGYGAGELSAINGIAGSYAQHIPLVHIVGVPAMPLKPPADFSSLSLVDSDFSRFLPIWQSLTVAQAVLTAENACAEIDRVLREVLIQRRPGYLLMTPDVATAAATLPSSPLGVMQPDKVVALPPVNKTGMQQDGFWRAIQQFIQPGDLLLAELGAAALGAATLKLPENCQLVVQSSSDSAGYSLPATFGAQTADPERRVILIISEGAAQLTIQELSSMMRDGLRPIIFLLNNDGYTVERAIHGASQRYNDIARWDWTQLPQAFSLDCPVQSWRVVETVQLTEVMKVIAQNRRMSLVEVVLPQMDIPPLLQVVTASLNQRNSR